MSKPRVVLDTVIFVRCLLNPHSRWGRLVFQQRHRYALLLSPPLIAEVLEVLHRPELTRKFRALVGMDRQELLGVIAQAEIVELGAVPAVSRDPKDNHVLATAVAAGADFLITEDHDLLVLNPYSGIAVLTARDFLDQLPPE